MRYFLNALQGKFSEKPDPGKQTVAFETITGHLVDVKFEPTKRGEAMRLYIVNQEDFYIVSMFVLSRQTNAFMLSARNVDFHSEMIFEMKLKDGKNFFSIYQGGKKVEWAFKKESESDEFPVFFDDKRAFLRKIIEEEVIPILQRKKNPFPYHSEYKHTISPANYFDQDKREPRVVKPMGSFERQTRKISRNNTPLS